jgi:peptidoglycan biosynthesis protein MviN/MurJ (putative lipid II flippase)
MQTIYGAKTKFWGPNILLNRADAERIFILPIFLQFHVDTCVCLLFVCTVMYIVMYTHYTEMHKQGLRSLFLLFFYFSYNLFMSLHPCMHGILHYYGTLWGN